MAPQRRSVDVLQQVPGELLAHVLPFLTPPEAGRLGHVSKQLLHDVQTWPGWEALLETTFGAGIGAQHQVGAHGTSPAADSSSSAPPTTAAGSNGADDDEVDDDGVGSDGEAARGRLGADGWVDDGGWGAWDEDGGGGGGDDDGGRGGGHGGGAMERDGEGGDVGAGIGIGALDGVPEVHDEVHHDALLLEDGSDEVAVREALRRRIVARRSSDDMSAAGGSDGGAEAAGAAAAVADATSESPTVPTRRVVMPPSVTPAATVTEVPPPTTAAAAAAAAAAVASTNAYRLFGRHMMERAAVVAAAARARATRSSAMHLRRCLDVALFLVPPLALCAAATFSMASLAALGDDSAATGVLQWRVLAPWAAVLAVIAGSYAVHAVVDGAGSPGAPGTTVLAGQGNANELSLPWLVSRIIDCSVEFDWRWDASRTTVAIHTLYCPGAPLRAGLAAAFGAGLGAQLWLLARAFVPDPSPAGDSPPPWLSIAAALAPLLALTVAAATVLPAAIVPPGWRQLSFPRPAVYRATLIHAAAPLAAATTFFAWLLRAVNPATLAPYTTCAPPAVWFFTSALSFDSGAAAAAVAPAVAYLAVTTAASCRELVDLIRHPPRGTGDSMRAWRADVWLLIRDILRRAAVAWLLAGVAWRHEAPAGAWQPAWPVFAAPIAVATGEATARVCVAATALLVQSRRRTFGEAYRPVLVALGYDVYRHRNALG